MRSRSSWKHAITLEVMSIEGFEVTLDDLMDWRRRPDLNRGWRFRKPSPFSDRTQRSCRLALPLDRSLDERTDVRKMIDLARSW